MRVNAGLVRTLVLVAWAGLFCVLWALDEGLRYLGPRTQWVIPFGAVTLTVTAVAHALLAIAGRRDFQRLTRAETAGALALLVPVLAVVAVPRAELGAQAASKRHASDSVLVASVTPAAKRAAADAPAKDSVEAPFLDIAVATMSPAEGAAMGLVPGSRIRVHGIVVHESDVPRTFGLTRFFISCCAADALPFIVPVDAGKAARPEQDSWHLIEGTLARRGSSLVVLADRMEATKEPKSPYVSTKDGGGTTTYKLPASSGSAPGATAAAPAAASAPAPAKASPAPSGKDAGFSGRAAKVYETYYAHCRVFTYEALAFPTRVKTQEEAARVFAGPPREFQPPAYRGCLDGLRAGEGRITVADILKTLVEAAEEG